MEFVDMSQNPPVEVTVLTLREIAFQIDENDYYGGYSRHTVLKNWIGDKSVKTPKSDFNIKGTDYWKPERLQEWRDLYTNEIKNEELRKAKALETDHVSKQVLVERLLNRAEQVKRRNASAYSHNRGNSLADGRRRVLELEGIDEFVVELLGPTVMTKDQRNQYLSALADAKNSVNMQ